MQSPRFTTFGCHNILQLTDDPIFKFTIFLSVIISYFCVVLDVSTDLNLKVTDKVRMYKHIGRLKEVIVCFDMLYLLDIIVAIVRHRKGMSHTRHIIFVLIDIATFIPYEFIYNNFSGYDVQVYVLFRMRYVLRFIRYAPIIRSKKVRKFRIFDCLVKFMVLTAVLALTGSCLRLSYACIAEKNTDVTKLINCTEYHLFDFTLSYFTINGQLTGTDLQFPLGLTYIQPSVVMAMFQFCLYLYLMYVTAQIICIYIELLSMKFQFAIICNLMLKNVARLKETVEKWAVQDEIFVRFLKKYMKNFWGQFHVSATPISSGLANLDYIVAIMPDVTKTEVTLDVSWNMFKHSALFKNEEVHFLRYVAQLTDYRYLVEGHIIWKRGYVKREMIYVVTGVVSLLSEINGETTSISFTGGTCLGESNLFISLPSKTTLVCVTYCEVIRLKRVAFLKMYPTYPEVYTRLRRTIFGRMEKARVYTKIAGYLYNTERVETRKDCLSIRYIKHVMRTYMGTTISNETGSEEDMLTVNKSRELTQLHRSVVCTDYLTQYMLADRLEIKTTNHFVVSGIGFKLHPNSALLDIWRYLVFFLIFITCLYYPIGATSSTVTFSVVYDFYMTVITCIWILDYLSFMIIAVRNKDNFYTNFQEILLHNLETLLFWIDLLSSVPVELIVGVLEGPLDVEYHRALQCNRLLKSYKLIYYLHHKQYSSCTQLVLFSIMKLLYTLIATLFLGYYIFTVFKYFNYTHVAPTFFTQICIVYNYIFSCGIFIFELDRSMVFFPLIFLQYVSLIWKLQYIPELIASVSLAHTTSIGYENIVDDVLKILSLYNFEASIKKKITKYLQMNYQVNRGYYMLHATTMANFIGSSMYRTERTMLYHNLYQYDGLFKDLPYHIICELNEIPTAVLVPKGEYLAYAGAVASEIYLIAEGICGFMGNSTEGTVILKTVTTGYSLLVLEVLCGRNVLFSIIALSDVKLLIFPYSKLLHKIVKYPSVYATIRECLSTISQPNAWQQVQHRKSSGVVVVHLDANSSYRNFRNDMDAFIDGFGSYKWFRVLFLKLSFKTDGRFWIWWEIVHVVIAYFSVLIGTIPITALAGVDSPVFWLFRLFDVLNIVDMYFRSHVMYYNKINVEVSHPWKTAQHYWCTAFPIDLLAMFPMELAIPNLEKMTAFWITTTRFNRYLQLYRAIGIKNYLSELYMSELRVLQLFYVCSCFLILMNLLIYTYVLSDCTIYVEYTLIRCRHIAPFWYSYFTNLKRCMKNTMHIGIYDGGFIHRPVEWSVIAFLGLFILLVTVAKFTATGLFRNSHLTTFQIKMQRLVLFMNMRNFDKALRDEIIKHYEYLWMLREGKKLKTVCRIFNNACFEDVMYAQYGKILHASVVFRGSPSVVMNHYLSSNELERNLILIRGVVIRVNDVQNKMYVIYKGEVEVLGPDFTKIAILTVGSLFGCMDDIKMSRSTLTYVAKTHCELLSMSSMKFYEIIKGYPIFHRNFRTLIRLSNADYISSEKRYSEDTHRLASASASSHSRMGLHRILNSKRFKSDALQRFFFKVYRVYKPNQVFIVVTVLFSLASFLIECIAKMQVTYSMPLMIVLYFVDFLSWGKVFVNTSTAYEDVFGLLVKKRRMIVLRYLKDYYWGFTYDLLCNFPFEIISLFFINDSRFWFVWSNCRLNRLYKIAIVFRYVRSVRNRLNINVYFIRLVYIILVVFTSQHVSIIIISYGLMARDSGSSMWMRYLDALSQQTYFMTTMTYYPFKTRKEAQIMNSIGYAITFLVVLIIGRTATVYVVAECASSYQVLNYSKFRYEAYLNNLETELTSKGASAPLRSRILGYFNRLAGSGRNVQFPSFIVESPYYLREGILDSMFGYHLRCHPIFKQCHSDLLRQLAATFQTAFFFPGDYITFVGDIDCKMYFIEDGELEGLSHDSLFSEVVDVRFKTGDSFGFKQMLYKNVGHKYSYKVISDCTILILRRQEIEHLFDFFPASKYILYNNATFGA